MVERSPVVMDVLLGMHREREPGAVLRMMLRLMEPEYGQALAVAYLLDPVADQFRAEVISGPGNDATRILWRAEIHLPQALSAGAALPPVSRLAESGIPVHVTDQPPALLRELWEPDLTDRVFKALGVKYSAVAPVATPQEPLGMLCLCLMDKWPVDVAAEATAHAAVALANLLERREAARAADRDADTGLYTPIAIEQVASREINRADRYRRVVSIVVAELPETDRSLPRVQELAAVIHRVMRGPDSAGQLATGRLAVVLPETPAAGAAAFVRRVQEGSPTATAGVRFAWGMFPQDGRNWAELVNAANNHLEHGPPAPLPGATTRANLRAAFPAFRMSEAPEKLSGRWGR